MMSRSRFARRSVRVWSRLQIWSTFISVTLLTASVSFGDDPKNESDVKKNDEAKIEIFEVDARGQPPSAKKVPEGPMIFLWQIGDTWYVTTRAKKNKHEFKGIISLHGGKVTKISKFTGLEAAGLKKKNKTNEDIGRWNAEQNQIDFKFQTAGGEDGFAFKIDSKVESVTFDFKIDNAYDAGKIVIGRLEKKPPNVPFTLSTGKSAAEETKESK